MNLNPGYSTWIIDPSQQNTLLLPNKEAKLFKKRYNKISKIIYENKIHKVQKGDSLYKISRIYNVKINSIKKKSLIMNKKGEEILIKNKGYLHKF